MMFESSTLDGNGRIEDLVVKKIPEFFLHFTPQNEKEVSTNYLCSWQNYSSFNFLGEYPFQV